MPLKEQPSPVCVDVEQAVPVSESKVVKTDSVATSSSVSRPDRLPGFIS